MNRAQPGFSLVELAVVVAIVALLIGGAMATYSSLTEQRTQDETTRRLNAAVDAIIGFAVINRRLPCPATAGTTGDEAPAGGGNCTTSFSGFLPAITVGVQPVDSSGYLVDPWGNRIRYAVAGSVALTGCTGSSTLPQFTSQANLKANGVSCKPGPTDLDVWNGFDACIAGALPTATSCTGARTVSRVVSSQSVAFIVFSTGKNGAIAANYGVDEQANTDGDRVFVTRPPSDFSATTGTYDDLMVFVPAGVLYQKLIAAGVLP